MNREYLILYRNYGGGDLHVWAGVETQHEATTRAIECAGRGYKDISIYKLTDIVEVGTIIRFKSDMGVPYEIRKVDVD